VLTVGVQIARALEVAHAKHVIHGNVLPETILVRTKDKVAKLEVKRHGRVRRAKLNYLRTRKGKEATAVRE
jgi:large subunit ribosomal protein L19